MYSNRPVVSSLTAGRRRLLIIICTCLALSGCASFERRIPNKERPSEQSRLNEPDQQALKSYIENARAAFAAGEQRSALMALQEAKIRYPGASAIDIAIGELFQELGQFELAREEFETVLIREPQNIHALQALGLLNLENGNIPLAKQLYLRMIQIDKQRVRAISPLLQVDKNSPPLAYNSLGIIADYEKQHETAAEYFLSALQIVKKPFLYNNLGYSRYLAGNFGPAEWAYKQALGLDPGYQPALRNLALLTAARGSPDQAAELLESNRDRIALYRELGRKAVLVSDSESAIDFFSKADEIAGGTDVIAKSELAKLRGAEATKTESTTQIEFVNTPVLRVRNSNSITADIIGRLDQGTAVKVIERNGDWSYVQIEMNSSGSILKGWVSSNLLADEAT